MVITYALRCTPADVLFKVVSRAGATSCEELFSRFIRHTVSAARYLSGIAVKDTTTHDPSAPGNPQTETTILQKHLYDYLTPPRRAGAPRPMNPSGSIGPAHEFSAAVTVIFQGLAAQMNATFFPDPPTEQVGADTGTEQLPHVGVEGRELAYLLALQCAKATVAESCRVGHGDADWHPMLTGFPAVFLRQAYLSVLADLVDPTLKRLADMIPDTGEYARARQAVAQNLRTILHVCAGAPVRAAVDVERDTALLRKLVQNIEDESREPPMSDGQEATSGSTDADNPDSDDERTLPTASLQRRARLDGIVKQRCRELTTEERFINMTHRENLPKELLRAFPTGSQNGCAQHRGQSGHERRASATRCSRCLLHQWLPLMSSEDVEAVVDEDYAQMSESLRVSVELGIELTTRQLLSTRRHLDEIARLSRVSQSPSELRRKVNTYLANNTDMPPWVREKVVAYGGRQVDLMRRYAENQAGNRGSRGVRGRGAEGRIERSVRNAGTMPIRVLKTWNARLSELNGELELVREAKEKVLYLMLHVEGRLTVDMDIDLPGTTLLIVAEYMDVVGAAERWDRGKAKDDSIFIFRTSAPDHIPPSHKDGDMNGKDGAAVSEGSGSRDGNNGTDGRSGVAGLDAGSIHIYTKAPIEFHSDKEMLRCEMVGGDGQSGGNGGHGSDGLSTGDKPDVEESSITCKVTLWRGKYLGRFAAKGDFAEMPGKGGNGGQAGCGGWGGRCGRFSVDPPIRNSERHLQVVTRSGKKGKDGATGLAGHAGKGGCDGRACVGYAWLNYKFKEEHYDTCSFYASESFCPGDVTACDKTDANVVRRRRQDRIVTETSFNNYALKPYGEHVVRYSIDRSREFVNRGVLYERFQMDGHQPVDMASPCEAPSERMQVTELVNICPLIAEIIGSVGGTTEVNDDHGDDLHGQHGVGTQEHDFTDEFRSSVDNGLDLVRKLLLHDMQDMALRLQRAGTLEEVDDAITSEAQVHQNVGVAAPGTTDPAADGRLGTASAWREETAEDGSIGLDAATLRELCECVGAGTKKSLPFPRLPYSSFLDEVLSEARVYNRHVMRLRRGEGNVIECLRALECLLTKMGQNRGPFMSNLVSSLYRSYVYSWARALFRLRGAELLEDVLDYLYPPNDDAAGHTERKVHPCMMEYFGSLVYRSLAFHHAHGAVTSVAERMGESAQNRGSLAQVRELVEEFLTCPTFDITQKLRGDNDYVGVGAAEQPTNLFRLFGPLLFPLDYTVEQRMCVFGPGREEDRNALMGLIKKTYGAAQFPDSEIETLDTICTHFASSWTAGATLNSSSLSALSHWLRSQANANTFHFFSACASSLKCRGIDHTSSYRELGKAVGAVRNVLSVREGREHASAHHPWKLEVMYRWRNWLWDPSTASSTDNDSALQIMWAVLYESACMRVRNIPDPRNGYAHRIEQEMLLFLHKAESQSSRDFVTLLSSRNMSEVRRVKERSQNKHDNYVQVLVAGHSYFDTDAQPVRTPTPFARRLREYLRAVALFYAGIHENAFRIEAHRNGGGDHNQGTGQASCEVCRYQYPPPVDAQMTGNMQRDQATSTFITEIPCVACSESNVRRRQDASELSYLHYLVRVMPTLATELAVDLDAWRSGSNAGPFTPGQIVGTLWCERPSGYPEGSFRALAQRVNREELMEVLQEGGIRNQYIGVRSHEKYDHQQQENPFQLPRHLPCRTYPHNARRLRRFLELAGGGGLIETLDRLVHQVGDETAHLRLALWPELGEMDWYRRRKVIPYALLLACQDRLERWKIEVGIRTFAERCYTREKLEEHNIMQTIQRFSAKASTGAMRLVEHQITRETKRGEYDTRSGRDVTPPFSPQVFKYVLLRLCHIPVELDSALVREMQESPLNLWLPNLSKLAHHVTLSMWAPWLQGMSETCWNFGLQVDEEDLEDYLRLVRSGVKNDLSSLTGNRIQILLEATESLFTPKEKLRMGLEKNPDTWRGEVERRRLDLVQRRQLSRSSYDRPPEERIGLMESRELSWEAIRERLRLSNTPVDDVTFRFCKDVYAAVNECLDGGNAGAEERFGQFREDYKKNYYRVLRTKQRASKADVKERERQLWNEKSRLKDMLVTVFLAFHQGRYRPRRVQVLSVVLLLKEGKSYLANINTGEGKTYVSGCVAAVKAYVGYTPLLLSSSNALAKESQAQHEPAFRKLFTGGEPGIDGRDSFGCHVSPASCYESSRDRHYAYNVLYSTLRDVIGDDLKANMDPEPWTSMTQLWKSPHWIILDEADLVMAGSITDMVYIGHANLNLFKELPGIPSLLEGTLWGRSDQEMRSNYTDAVKALCRSERDPSLRPERYQQLKRSARTAHDVQQDAQFVVSGSTTHPYSIATGTTLVDCVWRNCVTLSVNVMKGVQIAPETDITLSMAALTFLQRERDCLTGMTGTVGNHLTCVMYDSVYGMGTWRIPPAFPSQMLHLFPRIAFSDRDRDGILCKSLEESGYKQNCLCVHDTIRESRETLRALTAYKFSERVTVSLYVDDNGELPSLNTRGQRTICCSTQIGGRGVDYSHCSPDGIGVILLSPQEERGKRQGEGRAARQLDNGSTQCIFVDHVHDSPLPPGTVHEVSVSPSEDKDGYYRGEDEDTLRTQAAMLNAFYRVQNERIMLERKRLCLLADRDIPQTLFLHSLWKVLDEASQQIEKCLPGGSGESSSQGTSLKKVLLRLLQCRYVKWMQENEDKIMENGNRPKEQHQYLQDFKQRLSGLVEAVQRRPRQENAWSLVRDLVEDEEDIINGASALKFSVAELRSYFSTVAGVESEAAGGAKRTFATVPLYEALEAVQSGSWKTREGLETLRSHLEQCIMPLKRMHAVLVKFKEDVATMQKKFGVSPRYSVGIFPQLQEWITVIESLCGHIVKLVGDGGVVDFATIASIVNPKSPLLPGETFGIMKQLIERNVFQVRRRQNDTPSAQELCRRLEEVLSLPVTMFGQGEESFSTQFARAVERAGGDSTVALLDVLSSKLITASKVAELFKKAVDAGLVQPLEVSSDLFHLHNDDYMEEITSRLHGTHMGLFASDINTLCLRAVGVLRSEQVKKVFLLPVVNAITTLRSNTEALMVFRPLGFHQTLDVEEHTNCYRVRNAWSPGWILRVGAAVADVVVGVVVVCGGVSAALSCVKSVMAEFVAGIQTRMTLLSGVFCRMVAIAIVRQLVALFALWYKTGTSSARSVGRAVRAQFGFSQNQSPVDTAEETLTQQIATISAGLPDDLSMHLMTDSVENGVSRDAWSEAAQSLCQRVAATTTEMLKQRSKNGYLDRVLEEISKEALRDVQALIRAVKAGLDRTQYSSFLGECRSALQDGEFFIDLKRECANLLLQGREEVGQLAAAFCESHAAAERKSDEEAVMPGLNAIADIGRCLDVQRLLIGPSHAHGSFVHQRMAASVTRLWTLVRERYGVEDTAEANGEETASLSPEEGEFVQWVRRQIEAECLEHTTLIFSRAVHYGIELIGSVRTVVERNIRINQQQGEVRQRYVVDLREGRSSIPSVDNLLAYSYPLPHQMDGGRAQ